MGVVYKALDTHHLNRIVAIEILPAEALGDATRRRRFIHEAQAASAIDHPNIVTTEFSPEGSLVYFMSTRDGFQCLWAQRLVPATKKPTGSPLLLSTSRRAALPAGVPQGQRAISIARDKIVFTMEERTGNIWMMETDNRN